MACKIRNMSVLAYANGFTLWHYKTTDNLTDVLSVGYFLDVADMLSNGDQMHIGTADGAALVYVIDAPAAEIGVIGRTGAVS